MSSKLKQLSKESLVYGLSGVIGRFIGIFLVPIYTRIFVPSDYGVLDLIAVFSGIVGILIILGLDSAQGFYFYSTDDIADKKSTLSTSVAFQFALSVVLCATLFSISVNLSKLVFGTDVYATYFRLVALDLPFVAVTAFAQKVLRLIRSPWKYMFFAFSKLISNIVLTILMVVVWRKGIYGIYLSRLIVDALYSLAAVYLIKSWLSRNLSWPRLKQLLKYGIPLVPAGISQWVLGSANRYFLIRYSSLGNVGLYAVGNKIGSLMGLVTTSFQLAWGPFAFSIYREKDSKAVYADVLTYYLVLTSGIGIGLSLFAPEVLRIFTTRAYYGASPVVSYLAFGMIAYGAYYIVSIGVSVTKKTSHISWTTAVAAGVNIVLNFLTIPRLGMIGAAIGVLISQWISTGLLYLVSQHFYPIPYRLKDVFVILGSSAILIALGSRLQIPQLWLGIFAKTFIFLVFVAVLMITRVLPLDVFFRVFHSLGDRRK